MRTLKGGTKQERGIRNVDPLHTRSVLVVYFDELHLHKIHKLSFHERFNSRVPEVYRECAGIYSMVHPTG